MLEINKEFGYYGTIKNQYNDKKQLGIIWETTVKRFQQIYPEKSKSEIYEFLNAKTGRHFADEILDGIGSLTYAVVLMKIALLDKLRLDRWWAYHHGCSPVPVPIDKKLLYKTAIKSKMKKAWVQKLMKRVLGCEHDVVWYHPDLWLNADSTDEQELEMMWAYIQIELNKRTKHGNNTELRKETGSC